MAEPPTDPMQRDDMRARTRRDIERLQRREPDRRFWQALGVLGSVGWPIVLLAIGGATAGRYLDGRWHTGVRLTFTLLALGVGAGCWLSWRTIRGAQK